MRKSFNNRSSSKETDFFHNCRSKNNIAIPFSFSFLYNVVVFTALCSFHPGGFRPPWQLPACSACTVFEEEAAVWKTDLQFTVTKKIV